MIKITREVELEEFSVPTLVGVKNDPDGFVQLNKLNWETLDKLCVEFRAKVFKIAKTIDSKGE